MKGLDNEEMQREEIFSLFRRNQIKSEGIALVLLYFQYNLAKSAKLDSWTSSVPFIGLIQNSTNHKIVVTNLRNDSHILIGHEFLLSADLVMLLFFKQVSGPTNGQGQRCVNNRGCHGSKTNAHFIAGYCNGVESDWCCSIKNALNRTYCWSISENTPKSWFPVQYNTLWHRLSLAICECALHCVMDYITSQFILGWDFFKLYITVHYILQCITLQCNPDWVCSVHFGALQLIIAPNDVQCTTFHYDAMHCITVQIGFGLISGCCQRQSGHSRNPL